MAHAPRSADMPVGLNITGKALTPGAQRSWWLRQALAAEDEGSCPPLTQDVNADVVILGGGFTGLWTAYFLTEANPNLKIVVLEQDICGGGPSGRNGGFASGWWDELDSLITLGPPAVAITSRGSVRAPRAVMALNAWATGWPQLSRRLVAWSSYIVLTAPAPERLAEIGWTGGELITDLRTSLRYFRTTPDGRIAFGGGGGRASSRIGDSFTRDMRAVVEAAEGFRRLFPTFADIPLEDAWGGPIDVSTTHLPAFGRLESSANLYYALGYTGNGVAPSHLAGKVLADLVTGADTDATRLSMVNRKPRLFPPEPFRSIGAAVIRRAIIAKETAEERGIRPNPLTTAVARLPRRMGYLIGP